MPNLLVYIIAIIIVLLCLVGFALLAVLLRPSDEKGQQPNEKPEPKEVQGRTITDELPRLLKEAPKRRLLDIFRRSQRTIG